MFQFIFGFVAGAYTAQKYNIPDIENIFSELLNNLKNLEKDKDINNNNINDINDKNTINDKEPENDKIKEKKKFKFF